MVIEWFVCYEQKLREYLRKQKNVEDFFSLTEFVFVQNVIYLNRRLFKGISETQITIMIHNQPCTRQ